MTDSFQNEAPGWASLCKVTRAIGRHKRAVLILTLLGWIASFAYVFSLPPIYVATTIVVPPQQGAGQGLMAQLGSLASIAGMVGGGVGAARPPEEIYLAIIRSRSMRDDLIKRHDLIRRYQVEDGWDARDQLMRKTVAVSDKKSGVVTISVEDQDPVFSAKLANAYVETLRARVISMALTEAQAKRLYFENQIAATKAALEKSEGNFKTLKEKYGINLTELQAESSIRSSLELRRAIAEREIQQKVLSSYATNANPETVRLASELSALRAKLAQVEGAGTFDGGGSKEGTTVVSAFREMKIQSAALDALLKQLEIAKMDEAHEGSDIQVIDRAVPPEKPAKPNRLTLMLGLALASLLLSVFVAVTLEQITLARAGVVDAAV